MFGRFFNLISVLILSFLMIDNINGVEEKRFQPLQTTRSYDQGQAQGFQSETVRILTHYIDTYSVQCPSVIKQNGQPVRFEELFWLNEQDDHIKPDSSVLISSANLIDKQQLTIRINRNINFISCGYLYQNKYVRIKLWTLRFVVIPSINLQVIANPSLVTLKPINISTSSINVALSNNDAAWNQQLELLRFKCQTNYDIPLNTKYVWMYYRNPDTGIEEIWHRNDINNGVDDPYQIFMYDKYNSVMNKNQSVSAFIHPLLIGRVNNIVFQCASYKDSFQLLAKSHNLSLIKDGYAHVTYPIYHTTPRILTTTSYYNNGPLIGGIIGGILGLLLLLAIILLFVWYCCIRRTKRKETTVYYNQKNLASQSAVTSYPPKSQNNVEITQDGWRNLGSTSAAILHYPATQSTHTIENQERHQSHIEIMNANNNTHHLSSSNMANLNQNDFNGVHSGVNSAHNIGYNSAHHSGHRANLSGNSSLKNAHHSGQHLAHQTTIRSEAPELFLKTITLPKDAYDIEPYQQSYAQKDITINHNNGYITDKEFFAHRKEYFADTKNQNQSRQQQYEGSGTQFQYV